MRRIAVDELRSRLPSWRPGVVLDEVLAFLAASEEIAPPERVAVFDNDGTLWCEKPEIFQAEFFLHELRAAAAADPALAERPEYRALLDHDQAALAGFGLPRLAVALAELCAGLTAEEFSARSASFLLQRQHPTLGRPFGRAVYQPMLELLDALRVQRFATFIVSGGGTEFVRAISEQLYGVAPEGVVGTLIEYEYVTRDGAPALRRTGRISGDANEGPAKVLNIQQHLGRRPVFAAGNSAGDRSTRPVAGHPDRPRRRQARVRLRERRGHLRHHRTHRRRRPTRRLDGCEHARRLEHDLPSTAIGAAAGFEGERRAVPAQIRPDIGSLEPS